MKLIQTFDSSSSEVITPFKVIEAFKSQFAQLTDNERVCLSSLMQMHSRSVCSVDQDVIS